MNKILALLGIMGLGGCGSRNSKGSAELTPDTPQLDPEAYAAMFEALAAPKMPAGWKVTTKFKMVDAVTSSRTGSAVGGCNSYTKTIQLLKSHWDSTNGVDRKITVYHELGHCELYRVHLNTTQADSGLLTSVMNYYGVYWSDYQPRAAYYDSELISIKSACDVDIGMPCPPTNPAVADGADPS